MNSGTNPSDIFTDYVEARAHSQATEVPSRVENAIKNIFHQDLRDDLKVSQSLTEGHAENPIIVIEAVLNKKKNCLKELRHLIDNLSEDDLSYIRHTMSRRLDDDCRFYLRIDKQEAYLGNIHLAQIPDMISVEIRLRQYPRCEKRMAMEWLFNLLNR